MGTVDVAGLDRVLMRLGLTEEKDLEKVTAVSKRDVTTVIANLYISQYVW